MTKMHSLVLSQFIREWEGRLTSDCTSVIHINVLCSWPTARWQQSCVYT